MTQEKFTAIQKRNINKVKRILTSNPKGLTLDEINQESGLAIPIVQTALKIIESEIIYDDVEKSYALAELINTKPANDEMFDEPTVEVKAETAGEIASEPKPAKPAPKKEGRKMRSPTQITGYHIKGENVRIFLDKRHNAQSITLSVNDLKYLLKSVQKHGIKGVGHD